MSPTAAVYCATKYAVRAISEGLRQEVGGDIRVTVIAPGVTESELAESISDEGGRAEMKEFRKIAISADAIARAIAYAVEQPADVDVSELIVRPTASPFCQAVQATNRACQRLQKGFPRSGNGRSLLTRPFPASQRYAL